MKTDKEIKDWIDSQEVLTMMELYHFVCPWTKRNRPGKQERKRINDYWGYVLETKDWGKLREYRNKKINRGSFKQDNFDKFKEIYSSDKRIREAGKRKTKTLLNEVYNLNIGLQAIVNYKCILKNN